MIDNIRKPNSVPRQFFLNAADSDLPKKASIITSQNPSVSLGFFDKLNSIKEGISELSYHPPISKPSSALTQQNNVLNPED